MANLFRFTFTLKALGFSSQYSTVGGGGVFSTPLCKIKYRHPRQLKRTGLMAYIMFYKIYKFESLTITNGVIMTSLPKIMAKFGRP